MFIKVQEGANSNKHTTTYVREKHSLHLYNPHTDFGKRLVKFKGSRLWNNLRVKILNSIPAFKNSLKNYLLTA